MAEGDYEGDKLVDQRRRIRGVTRHGGRRMSTGTPPVEPDPQTNPPTDPPPDQLPAEPPDDDGAKHDDAKDDDED